MRVTVYVIFLFFVCMNISLYFINETQVLPYRDTPYEEPQNIQSRFISLDLSTTNLVIAGSTLTIALIVSYIGGYLLFGGTIGLLIFALMLLVTPVKWIIGGLPTFLGQMGMPSIVYTPVMALIAVVFFWFMLGFIAQRPMGED